MQLSARKLLILLLLLAWTGSSAMAAEPLFKRKNRRERIVNEQESTTPKSKVEAAKAEAAEKSEPESITRLTPALPEPPRNLTVAQYDSLVDAWASQRSLESFENYFRDYIQIDPAATAQANPTPDSVYVQRLRDLVSPIELPYNYIVKASITRYTDPNYGLMSRILGMAQHYFPMIEQELILAGLPIELRAMAIIESALQPTAVSRAGAAGLWQFMPATGKVYGLEVNSLVDERFDPLKATKAACRYLKDLYGIYHNWPLAIAAYNCGPGNVNKAMARSGGKTFWEIYDFLPRETRGYVPAFIGASYAYAYHRQHGIEPAEPLLPLAVDTLHVKRLLHLGQVTSTLENLPLETLKLLNPQYRIDIIPATTKSYVLTLPQYAITSYITSEETIHSKDSVYLKEYLNPANLDKKRSEASGTFYHKVKRGETLGKIAQRYNVSQKNLMRWNGIKNPNKLREGQRLKIIRG